MFEPLRDRWTITIAVAACLLRLGWAAAAGVFLLPPAGPGSDERAFVELARDLARDPSGFLLHDEHALWRAPGQVAYLAACGQPLAVVRALNVVWSTATVILSMLLAGWAGGAVAARTAGLAVALSPPLISGASSLLSETPFTALLLGGLAALGWAVRSPRGAAWWAVVGGILLGVASLFRPLALAVAPAIAVGATACTLFGVPAVRGLRRPAWIAVGASFAVLLPVMFKNQIAFGRFAIANGLGAVAYLGAHPLTAGDEPVPIGVRMQMPECSSEPHSTACEQPLLRQAVRWIRADPGEFLLRMPVKVHRAWVGNQRDVFYPARGWRDTAGLSGRGVAWRIASVLAAALLSGLFLGTVFDGAWKRAPEVLLVTVSVAVMTLVSALTFAVPRYGEPLMPCFAVAAAVALAPAGSAWPRRSALGLGLGAGLALCTFLGP